MDSRNSQKNNQRFKEQNIYIENRKKISLSGVTNVINFNSQVILLETSEGTITIKGENLNITKLNVEDGNIVAEGFVISCVYSQGKGARGKEGLLKTLFK